MNNQLSEARRAKSAKAVFTGTRHGGNPPDAGSAYWRGKRFAWLPIDHIMLSDEHFDRIFDEHRKTGEVLSRQRVAALLD